MSTPEYASAREIVFLDRPFSIDETVHRPRISTEWITQAGYIAYINQRAQPVTVADIGVGSGVIAISCALECSHIARVYGVDLYGDALRIAARNVDAHKVNDAVNLLQGDLYAPLLNKPVNVILANLPFANTVKIEAIKSESAESAEPLTGIYGGDTGFELYDKLFDQLKDYRYMDGVLGIWVFCGTEHAERMKRRYEDQFAAFTLLAFKDRYKPHFSHFLLTKVAFDPSDAILKINHEL